MSYLKDGSLHDEDVCISLRPDTVMLIANKPIETVKAIILDKDAMWLRERILKLSRRETGAKSIGKLQEELAILERLVQDLE